MVFFSILTKLQKLQKVATSYISTEVLNYHVIYFLKKNIFPAQVVTLLLLLCFFL